MFLVTTLPGGDILIHYLTTIRAKTDRGIRMPVIEVGTNFALFHKRTLLLIHDPVLVAQTVQMAVWSMKRQTYAEHRKD